MGLYSKRSGEHITGVSTKQAKHLLFIHTNIYLQTWSIMANYVIHSDSTKELQINSMSASFAEKWKQI